MEATDEAAEEEAEEDCSKTVAATGVEAATSGVEAVTTEGRNDDGDDEEDGDVGDSDEGCDEAAGTEFWDDSLPDTLGNEHTSHVVMSSWFWNVQRLQVHCSSVLGSPLLPPTGRLELPDGADSDRPSIVYDEEAVTVAEGGCCRLFGCILGGGGRGGRGGRFAIGPAVRIGDPSILGTCRPSAMEAVPVVSSAESTSFCMRSASWRRS